MQHIVNIAFDFDDDKVKAIAEKAVENEMDSIIKNIVLDKIAPQETYLFGKKGRDWDTFDNIIYNRIDCILGEHKDKIIELASTKLVESVKRTKVWKEKYKDIIGSDATPKKD